MVCELILELNAAAGWVIVTVLVVVQLFASVIVTTYAPEVNPVKSCVVGAKGEPFLVQLYVYAPVPPETPISIAPVVPPKHNTLVEETKLELNAAAG